MKQTTNRTLLPPPWVLVLVGLVLNILAILMSSLVVESFNQQIAALRVLEAQNQYAIQLDWNSVETLERKREALLLHLHLDSQSTLPNAVADALMEQFELWVASTTEQLSLQNLPDVMQLIDDVQREYRESIDSHYLNNVQLTEQIASLEDSVAHYRNIALFLQIFGLALIIARDLTRKS